MVGVALQHEQPVATAGAGDFRFVAEPAIGVPILITYGTHKQQVAWRVPAMKLAFRRTDTFSVRITTEDNQFTKRAVVIRKDDELIIDQSDGYFRPNTTESYRLPMSRPVLAKLIGLGLENEGVAQRRTIFVINGWYVVGLIAAVAAGGGYLFLKKRHTKI
jgi:hypothetical protein